MDKRKITFIISAFCIALVLGLFTVYLFKNNIISSDAVYQNIAKEGTTGGSNSHIAEQPGANNENRTEQPSILRVLLKEGAEYPVPWLDFTSETEAWSEILVRLEDLEITKKQGDFDRGPDYLEKEKDSEGNIVTDYSYVVAKMSFTNKGVHALLTGINRMCLIIGDEDIMYTMSTYNSGRTPAHEKDYFLVNYLPEEEYTYHLVFLVEDEILQKYPNEIYILASYEDSQSMSPIATVPIIEKDGSEIHNAKNN